MKYELINAEDAPPPNGRVVSASTFVKFHQGPAPGPNRTIEFVRHPNPEVLYTQEDLERARREMNDARLGKNKRAIKRTTDYFNRVWQYLREHAK